MNSRVAALGLCLLSLVFCVLSSGCGGIPPNPFDDSYDSNKVFQYDLNSKQWIRTALSSSCNDDGSLSVLVERSFEDDPVEAVFDGTAVSASGEEHALSTVGGNVPILEEGTVLWSADMLVGVDTLRLWWAYDVCSDEQLESNNSRIMCIQYRPVMTKADHCTKK